MNGDFTNYNLLKVNEGGAISQRDAIKRLRDANIKARNGYSIYVAHYGIEVFGNKRIQAKAKRLLNLR